MEMEKKMRIFQGATNGALPKASQKKLRRSRKPKFEHGKPKRGYVHKKKDKKKKRKQTAATLIAKLGLEEFPLMFSEARARNQRLQEFNSAVDSYILDKLKTWDDEGV
ncbi:hypothetical protein V6N13_074931 [Hibiscus sabdariffa]|uniref:Uncharacterized protein n=1 Tax=Hibiscus sabdariffa TaxID=183260 RepID=A0ABR2U9X7_9ROSI